MKHENKKFWRKNERDVCKQLGLRPVPGSGAGMEKEDGENDYILCQLKSTDAASYQLRKLDVEKLLYHAEVDCKIPLFVIQFMDTTMPLLALIPVDELQNVSKYLNGELFNDGKQNVSDFMPATKKHRKKPKIRASKTSNNDLLDQLMSEQYNRK